MDCLNLPVPRECLMVLQKCHYAFQMERIHIQFIFQLGRIWVCNEECYYYIKNTTTKEAKNTAQFVEAVAKHLYEYIDGVLTAFG